MDWPESSTLSGEPLRYRWSPFRILALAVLETFDRIAIYLVKGGEIELHASFEGIPNLGVIRFELKDLLEGFRITLFVVNSGDDPWGELQP